MAYPNYGINYVPTLVQALDGGDITQRTSYQVPMKSSQTFYYGQPVDIMGGTTAAPTGAEFGAIAHVGAKPIVGFVKGIHRAGANYPIQSDGQRAGTFTSATTFAPWKYVASATNDESNTTSMVGELVEINLAVPGDIWEILLCNDGGTAYVARGTTTAWGTTNSSANTGVGLTFNTTAPWALTESTAAKAFIGLDVLTTTVNGLYPKNPNAVFVFLLRTMFGYFLPIV